MGRKPGVCAGAEDGSQRGVSAFEGELEQHSGNVHGPDGGVPESTVKCAGVRSR